MTIDDAKKAFTDIYNREQKMLFRFCFLRVSDREKALEITQETFTKLWVHMAEGKTMEYPKAYLYTVMRHLIIDWYKKGKTKSLESLTNDGVPFEPGDEEVVSKIEISSDAGRILEKINDLNPEYRDVIYLRFVEDLPPKEIAKMLKLNANIVSIRITRGLQKLRESLGITIE